MTKLSKKQAVIIALTFFSLLFGAGNLIFPPFVGYQMKAYTAYATLGLIITGVVLPVICVVVISKHESLINLTNKIHPIFTIIYTSTLYLLIGPLIATPRTASTSFEMSISPFLQLEGNSLLVLRLIYSVIFFGLAFYVAKNPNRLKDLLGKIMSPILVFLIVFMFVVAIFKLNKSFDLPLNISKKSAFLYGFDAGYQTMDMLAALIYGIIISLNIKAFGVEDKKVLAKETVKAGIITGIMLSVIYSMTAYLGAVSSGMLDNAKNGARVLSFISHQTLGIYGQIIIGIIFFIACFSVCIGLIASCAKHFSSIVPKISYNVWLIIMAVSSFILSVAGLDFILSFSIPILKVISPISLVVLIYGIIRKADK